MKSQSETLKALLEKARTKNIIVKREPLNIVFYDSFKVELLSFKIFSVDYTMSDAEFETYMKKLD